VLSCAAASACFPPTHSDDYSVPFARSYWSAAPEARPPLASLSVEQLYALNQYGRRAFHPWRTMAPAFGCRGAEAIPFLKTKITPRTVGGLLELFIWMRWMETYDAAADAELMKQIRSSFAAMPRDLRRAYAPDLATIEARPFAGRNGRVQYESAEALRARYCTSPAGAILDSDRRER
jgi:hypothetical protein